MTINRRQLLAGGLGLAGGIGLSACESGSGSPGRASGPTKITVMGLPPETETATRQAFLDRIAAFEKANPAIKVVGSDAPWDVKTFAAKMAGGNAETMLRIPLTEPPGLIQRRQVAAITAEAEKLPVFPRLDPKIVATLSADGAVYGLPESMYTLALIYHRGVFAEAGLDPDRPPTTWAEFRAAAKQITQRTGKVGYAPLTTNNSGGWHLTAMTYSNGGVMQKAEGDRYVATFNDTPSVRALQLLQAMRFEDGSLGTNMLRKSEDLQPEFAAGRIGMWINGVNQYNPFVGRLKADPADFGITSLPQGPGNATLLGGTVEMVTTRATEAERAAAVAWIDYQYLQPQFDPKAAVAQAQANAKDNLPVGVPGVPVFDQEAVDAVTAAIAPYVNVPLDNFTPYVEGTKRLSFVPEPSEAAQDLYAALDPVVQKVLSDPDADPATLLDEAAEQVDALLSARQ